MIVILPFKNMGYIIWGRRGSETNSRIWKAQDVTQTPESVIGRDHVLGVSSSQLNEVARKVTLVACILKVSGSNLGQDIG
jgi:hypothetical protein